MRLSLVLTLLAGSLCYAAPAPVQSLGSVDAAAFFSGVVTELAADRLTVSRAILGKAPENRTFAITGETKVEGKLKTNSRVTVRFASGGEGDVAVSIVVRSHPEDGQKKKKQP